MNLKIVNEMKLVKRENLNASNDLFLSVEKKKRKINIKSNAGWLWAVIASAWLYIWTFLPNRINSRMNWQQLSSSISIVFGRNGTVIQIQSEKEDQWKHSV